MSMRKIKVRGETWNYKVGMYHVVLESPSGLRYAVEYTTLTGRSWDVIERGKRKGTSDGSITPKNIREYINKTMARSSTG